MKALVTGASTGIGREMAIYLSELGYDLYVVARSGDKLKELKDNKDESLESIFLELVDHE